MVLAVVTALCRRLCPGPAPRLSGAATALQFAADLNEIASNIGSSRLGLVLLRHGYDYFASSVALFQVAKRVSGLTQFVSPVDDWSYLSRLHQIGQDYHVLFIELRDVGDEFLTHEP